MKTKKQPLFILGAVLAMLLCSNSAAQQPDFLFEHPYPYPILHTLKWEVPYTFTLEVAPESNPEGCYLVAVSDLKPVSCYESDSVAFPPMVYKVSHMGTVVGELPLGYEGRFSFVVRLFDDPAEPSHCLAIGYTHDNNLHYDRPFMAKFDHDLHLMWQKEIELPGPYRSDLLLAAIMDSSGDIICFSGVSGANPIFYRLTTEGELTAISPYQYPTSFFINNCGSLFEYRDGSGDYGQVLESDGQRYLVRINRNLELVNNQAVPKQIHEENASPYFTVDLSIEIVHTCIPLPDGSVILGGDGSLSRQYTQFDWAYDDVIGFMRIDADGNIVSYAYAGQGEIGTVNDSIKVMNGATCSDMAGEDNFYFSYMVGGQHGFGYDYINSLVVTKMDIEGNIIWQRYWNRYYPEYDMKVYESNCVTTLSDGGCLVSGYCYYSDINGSNRYGSPPEIFLLKFFANGTFSAPEMEEYIRPYAFWPNPAKDELQMKYSPDMHPAQVELYDMQGFLVRAQSSGLEQIEMQDLATGNYLMRVTMKNGKVFTDKVVKE